jgi:hypothetical protein
LRCGENAQKEKLKITPKNIFRARLHDRGSSTRRGVYKQIITAMNEKSNTLAT